MKKLLVIVVLILACAGAGFSQTTTKLGDAYGVAAVRVAIQFVNNWDKSGALLNELEAQITGPAEQSSYDVMLSVFAKARIGQRAVNEKYDALMSKQDEEVKAAWLATEHAAWLVTKHKRGQREEDERLPDSIASPDHSILMSQWEGANAAYADSLRPCFTALKTNLQHRDGTMPKECQ
jgi:hypothetical protein